jgi:hypothetical protein
MSNVEYKECDECKSRRQIKPLVVGGNWGNDYTLTHGTLWGSKTVDLCCDKCLESYVIRRLQEGMDVNKNG